MKSFWFLGEDSHRGTTGGRRTPEKMQTIMKERGWELIL